MNYPMNPAVRERLSRWAPDSIDRIPTTPTISVDEFAAVVGISRGSAFNAVKNGEVPALRFGKRIRIPTAAVARMLEIDDTAAAVG